MILSLGSRPLTKLRYGQGSWDSTGRYVNTSATSTAFLGSFQPINTKLQRERGGERRAATHIIYTYEELRGSLPQGGPLADRVTVPSGPDAGTYEVESCRPYDTWAPIPHYEAGVVLYNEPDPTDPMLSATVAEKALQFCRTLIKAACNLTDSQCVVQQDKAPRPDLPYLAVLIDSYDEGLQAADSQAYRNADTVTVTGGTTGSTYTITCAGTQVTVTREAGDTNADVAAALASALYDTGDVETQVSNAVVTIIPLSVALDTVLSGTGTMTLDESALPATVGSGFRRSRLSLWGYGESSRPWIERVRMYLSQPDAITAILAGGFSVAPAGDIVVETVDLGTAYELRYSCALDIRYVLNTVGQAGIEAENVLVTGTASSSGVVSGLPFTVEYP